MRIILAAALALTFGCASAHAQTTSEPPPAAAAPTTAAPAAPTATPSAKEVRAQCRDQVKSQGLKGPARKAAVDDCFAKARPDLAARQKCREEGKAKGLEKAELRGYIKTCLAGGQ